MTYDMYRYIFLGALIACGIFLVIAIVLFFTLKIPRVISDLTGRTARKAIENIRMQNERSGNKTYQSSTVNLKRGKLTDKISPSGRLIHNNETPFGTGAITAKISSPTIEQPAGETDVLTVTEETSVLSAPAGETDVLTVTEETSVLSAPAGETDVLAPAEPLVQAFTVEYEITFVHTTEIIA